GKEHLLEQLAAPVVAQAPAQLDGDVERLDGDLLDLEVELQLLGYGLAHVDPAQPLQVGNAFEVEDALDEAVGVAHLADGLFPDLLPEALVTPVLAHPGVDEVLVDRGELGRQYVVQRGNDLILAFHRVASASVAPLASATTSSITMRQDPQSVAAPQALATSST